MPQLHWPHRLLQCSNRHRQQQQQLVLVLVCRQLQYR
jgi:hypothetical protein